MGIKIGGFVCDNCSIFHRHEGVCTDDLDILFNENGEEIGTDNLFRKIKGWKYYNIDENSHMGSDWIKWDKESICLCPKCDRLIKIKKLISKI